MATAVLDNVFSSDDDFDAVDGVVRLDAAVDPFVRKTAERRPASRTGSRT